MPYQFQSCIRYSETGESRRLTLPGVINYFQDCSTFQSETVGDGAEIMLKEHRAWVLAYWQIEVLELPALGDLVTAQTWASSFKGFQGNRNYRLLGETGDTLVRANSLWINLDRNTGHPMRISEELRQRYPIEPALEMEKTSRKICVPEELARQEAFEIKKYHLDTNHHVNNAWYITMALEYLPEQMEIGRVRVEYRKSALLGDTVIPMVHREENLMTVSLCACDGKPYAVVEFTGR